MTTWILLRGLSREARHWGGFPALLRAQTPGAALVALDLPGNGALHRLRSPLSIEPMVEFCRQQLAARGAAPPYHVLGLSMGAMVAAAWGTLHAQELSGCVLINSSLRWLDPFYRRLRPGALPDLLALLGGNAARQERAVLRLTSNRADALEAVLDAWLAYRRECPVSRSNVLRQLIAAARYRAPERRPAPRVLVLASAQDALVNPVCSQHLAAHWNAPIAVHPSAGHDLPLDDAAWVAARVGDWLAYRA